MSHKFHFNKLNHNTMKITAIFVAAGSSTRMGAKNKLLLNYGNATLVEHTFKQLNNSLIDEIVIVTGFEATKITATLQRGNLKFAHNFNHLTGLTSSIKTGIKAIGDECDGYMITLSDMPYLTTSNYNAVINTFRANYKKKPLIVVPKVKPQIGNPVIFSKEWRAEILAHQNLEGCKAIIQKNNKFVKRLILRNQNAFNDIDYPKDYQKLINVRVKPTN